MASLAATDILVQQRLPPGTRFQREVAKPDEPPRSTLSVALFVAQNEIERQLVFYDVLDSTIGSFSIPMLDPAPLVQSRGRTGIIAGFAHALDPGSPARMALIPTSRALCLHTLAASARENGCPAVAERLEAAADAAGVTGLLGPWMTHEGHDVAKAVEERGIVTQFFGLLHEAGHVYAYENPELRLISDMELENLVARACQHDPSLASVASLAPDHLRSEISADVACIRWLSIATYVVMQLLHDEEENPLRLLATVASMSRAFALENLCRQVADDCSGGPATFQQTGHANALLAGFDVRLQIASDFALQRVQKHLKVEAVRAAKLMLKQMDDRYVQMLTGFDLALPEVYRYSNYETPTIGLRSAYLAQSRPTQRRHKFADRLRRWNAPR